MTKPMRMIVATDFSPTSTRAFQAAVSMARGNGAELLIAHAYQMPNLGLRGLFSPKLYEDCERRIRGDAEERLQSLVDGAAREGVKAYSLVLSGDPYDVLVDAAEDRAADLMILGTHGRRGISRLLMGSLASRVMSTARCPVLTVRAA